MNGYETKVGIGLEATDGTPVKAQELLYHRSDTVEGEYNNVTSKALASGRFPGQAVAGNATVGGSVVIEPTMGDIGKILYAAMGKVVIGGGPDPFQDTYTVSATGPKPITHIVAKGLKDAASAIIEVHKGAYINQLTLAADLDEFLVATLDLVARGEKVYANTGTNDTALFGTAALSTLPAMAYTMGSVTLNGTSTCDVRNATITLNNGMREKRGLCASAGRFPGGLAAGMTEVTFDANLYFSSDAERRRLMGVASGASYPYEATNTTITGAVVLTFTVNAATNTYLEITLPKLEYLTAPAPVEGDDFIMQAITARALYDSSTGGLQVLTSNSTALPDPTTAGTPIA
jgi:hypothetical protein